MSQLFVDTIRNRDGNGAPVFDKGIVITGIITASGSLGGDSVSIGATEVISSGFQLTNILGLDATTTATIESAVAAAPNDFTSLNVSGISTFGSSIDLNSSIDILGHTEANTLNAVGILTALLLSTGAEGSAIRISSNTISGPATLTIDPAGIGTNTGTVVIQGDLQVEGDTTTVNSTNLTIDDKNIILASGSLTDASSDGGGITLESGEGNKTINWVDSTDSWTFSENIDLASSKTFKINGVDILTATTLGSSVVNSSLTSVGTLTALNVSGDLDVDGHTNLDNVNVSGAITATTFTGNLEGTVNTASQTNITSVGTLTGLTVSGDIDVDGHTNLDNVSISGVVTSTGGFNGDIYINESVDDDVDYNIMMLQETGGGNTYRPIMVDDGGVQFNPSSNKLTLQGTSGVQVYGTSGHIDAVNINLTGIATATTINATTFVGDGDFVELDVDGHTNLDNVSIAGVATVGLTTVLETGILTHDLNVSGVSTFNGDIRLTEQDGSGIYFGAGLDFAIAHDGSNSYLFERGGTGNVYLAGSNEVIIADASGSGPNPSDYVTETKARFVTNGPVRLYYDNVEKFATAGSGATVYGTFTADTLSVSGISTFTGDIDVDGHTNLDNASIAGVSTFEGSFVRMAPGGGNSGTLKFGTGNEYQVLAGSNKLQLATAADRSIELSHASSVFLRTSDTGVDITGGLTVSGISTFNGFVYNKLDSDTDLRNGGDFNNITGVAWTSGGTDTLYWDFATAPSVIGGEADNGIGTIELANLPTSSQYSTRATLITYIDNANDWDEGNVVVKVNGQTPTNYLWRNGAQPVGTTTGASNKFDIVEFKIVHDTNNEFSVFAEWQAYHATT